MLAQILGGLCGAIAAHLMFRLPYVSLSQHARSGPAIIFSEFVATFGLLAVIRGSAQLGLKVVAFAVGAWITAAYWFTASTSFANPAVTIARSLSDTFAGIRPVDVPYFPPRPNRRCPHRYIPFPLALQGDVVAQTILSVLLGALLLEEPTTGAEELRLTKVHRRSSLRASLYVLIWSRGPPAPVR